MKPESDTPASDGVASEGVTVSKAIGKADLISESKASPTKQQRVFKSSMTASVRTSSGTRVAREDAGTCELLLRVSGGG